MKKTALILVAAILIALCSCVAADNSTTTMHTIGVAVYNSADNEVIMFRDYLENYIGSVFEDVKFLYSGNITNEDELSAFLAACAEQGAEGILSFVSYDLKAETDFCAGKKMYYLRCAGTVDDAQFDAAADNPYFLGEIGPGAELETLAGEDLVRAMVKPGESARILVLSGGAFVGNEMHRLRTLAMLRTLEDLSGSSLPLAAETIAATDRVYHCELGALRITVCPGFVSREPYRSEALKTLQSGDYDVVISSLAVSSLLEELKSENVRCGVVDCFSEENRLQAANGVIQFVAGKYQSEIGPGFAAIYNAVTGNAAMLRENGRAFRLRQGFWTAGNASDYEERYALAGGAAINAYSYEDLAGVIVSLNPDADFAAFCRLVDAWRYEDCLARRG